MSVVESCPITSEPHIHLILNKKDYACMGPPIQILHGEKE